MLYCGSSEGQVSVWDTRAGRCFLAWEADDGEIGGYLTSPRPLGHRSPGSHSAGAVRCPLEPQASGDAAHASSHSPGVLLCSGTWLVSGSNTRRLRLWAVGAVSELWRRGSGAR